MYVCPKRTSSRSRSDRGTLCGETSVGIRMTRGVRESKRLREVTETVPKRKEGWTTGRSSRSSSEVEVTVGKTQKGAEGVREFSQR